MGRVVLLLSLTLVAGGLAGCGDDDDPVAPPAAVAATPGQPVVARDTAFGLLRDAGLRLQRTAAGVAGAATADPAPVTSARYAEKSGAQFDLLVFASAEDAGAAEASVRATRGVADVARGVNLVAAFPAARGTDTTYGRVADVLRELDAACGAPDGDAALRRACFGVGGGSGVGGRPQPRGSTLQAGGLAYRVVTSRRLASGAGVDQALTGGAQASPGHQWFGVWLRVCNPGDAEVTARATVALVGAAGARAAPEPAPDTAVLGKGRVLGPGECVPATSKVTEVVAEGGTAVFDAPRELLRQLPVALEVSAGGRAERVELDP